MSDQLINQKRYERELSKRQGYSNMQCALMVWVAIGIPSTIIYWVG